MGCGSTQEHKQNELFKIKTVTGHLIINVVSADLTHSTSIFSMDPYIVVRLSNQKHQTKVAVKGDTTPTFNQSFFFFINSCYKAKGRTLEVKVKDRNKVGSDKTVGYGIVDLDPIINQKKVKEPFRCFINYDSKPAGFVNFIAEFVEEPAKTISFRLQTATIRKSSTTFGTMKCSIHIEIGEEELETDKQKNTLKHIPNWSNKVISFNVCDSIPECKVSLYDGNSLIGSTSIELRDLLNTNQEQKFVQQLVHEGCNAGTLVFNTLVGDNPIFSPIQERSRKSSMNLKTEKAEETLGSNIHQAEDEPLRYEEKRQQRTNDVTKGENIAQE